MHVIYVTNDGVNFSVGSIADRQATLCFAQFDRVHVPDRSAKVRLSLELTTEIADAAFSFRSFPDLVPAGRLTRLAPHNLCPWISRVMTPGAAPASPWPSTHQRLGVHVGCKHNAKLCSCMHASDGMPATHVDQCGENFKSVIIRMSL